MPVVYYDHKSSQVCNICEAFCFKREVKGHSFDVKVNDPFVPVYFII